MRKTISALLMLVLLLTVSLAFAEINISEMTTDELSVLRDKINNELNNRAGDISKLVVETSDCKLSFSGIEEGTKDTVNDYFNMYEPRSIERQKSRYLIIPFTLENKSDRLMDFYSLDKASINGWVVTGHIGLLKVPAGKKGKGFIYFDLVSSELNAINDFDSAEFQIVVEYDESRETRKELALSIIQSESGFIIKCNE